VDEKFIRQPAEVQPHSAVPKFHLENNFQEKVSLQTATGNSHPGCLAKWYIVTMSEIPIDQNPTVKVVSPDRERAIVFLGGLGYDEQRNRDVGAAIVRMSNYSHSIAIPDPEIDTSTPKDGVIVHRYPDGSERELSGKESLKLLGRDNAEVRFSKLHADRARQLIAAIEADGAEPVDAVFQSVDVSTGLLAIHERPELFNNVVFLDPSSIIDLPPRKQYLLEEWLSGNLKRLLKRKRHPSEIFSFEEPIGRIDKIKRSRRTNANGNLIATYVSSQAKMLHDIAKLDHAPNLSIIASQFDHAYSPTRLISSLVDLDDIRGFFVTNMRHGLGGKQIRLEQVIDVLQRAGSITDSFLEKLHFFEGVSDDYRKKLIELIKQRLPK
jgi:hypothetical protein